MAVIKRFEIDELHGLMRQIDNWEKHIGNKDGKMKFQLYGSQRAYIRVADERYPVAEVAEVAEVADRI